MVWEGLSSTPEGKVLKDGLQPKEDSGDQTVCPEGRLLSCSKGT